MDSSGQGVGMLQGEPLQTRHGSTAQELGTFVLAEPAASGTGGTAGRLIRKLKASEV
jgi:hypothetical protein